jgi:hypothetical protein
MSHFSEILDFFDIGNPTQLSGWRNSLYRHFKRVMPEAFDREGHKIRFVGNKTSLLAREKEIMEKIIAAGWIPPTSTTKQNLVVSDDKTSDMTDEELFERINDTFTSITLLAEAAASLKIRSMIVSGSPGTGKTFEVVKAIEAQKAKNQNFYFHHLKGTISTPVLFIELYHARNGVLILDDTDEAFTDNESLQLLKAATESNKARSIAYRKLSMALEAEGVPTEFNFNGCVIVLTNTNLEDARKGKQSHYDAIMSRAHYVNAVLKTDREKLMRIRHVITTTSLLDTFLDRKCHAEIIEFIEEHHNRFRELSIRTVVKLAELRNAFPTKWGVLARGTLIT